MLNSFVISCTIARQAPLFLGFSRQEHWSHLSFSSPGDLPDPRMEPMFPVSPALQADSLSIELSGKFFLYLLGGFKTINLLLIMSILAF